MTRLVYIFILLIIAPLAFVAQTREKIDLNDGVENYERGRYKDAQTNFEKAYAENPNYARALYNAGNSAYLAGNFDTAMIYYNDYATKVQSKKEIAKAHFNVGNANLQKAAKAEASQETAKNAQAFYKEAISAYKKSLKNNPNDIEAKYNLTYALDKLQKNQEQQEQEGEGEDNKDQKDQGDKSDKNDDGQEGDKGEDGNKDGDKGDKKDGDQNGDEEGDEKGDEQDDSKGKPEDEEKESDEKDGEGQNGKDGEQNEEQPVEGQISKAQAIKDLDAINADEGKILQKVYQKKGDQKVKKSSDKDW